MNYKHIIIRNIHILILLFYSQYSYSQVFDNSQAHSNVKWRQINTDRFQLIFPEEFSSLAPKVAQDLDLFLTQTTLHHSRKTKKIPFIIQSNHIQQNGFVILAPRKSELYSTPSSIADNQEWLPNLALHETRHVVQFDNLTGKLSGPFLQQLALALFGLNLPSWYFEGDAVLQETLFSKGGRGRLTSWNMPIRANLQSGKNFNFNKYVHGSFKDIVPSYYTIGYLMNSELYQIDTSIHGKILDEMKGKLLRPFNFQKALKKYSNMSANQLFNSTVNHLKTQWDVNEMSIEKTQTAQTDRYPTDYHLPQIAEEKLYALKDSRQEVQAIVSIHPYNQDQQKRIVEVGQQLMPYFHIQQHLIVWDEYRRDPRFQKQTYNIINLYDLHTKKVTTLTKKTRYYTPVISPDLSNIACVEVDQANASYLVILDRKTGKVSQRIAIPKGMLIQQPSYRADGKYIVAIAVDVRGTNLIEIDLENKETKTLLEWSNFQYERPIYHKENIVFKANYNDKDDIYEWKDGKIFQRTQSRFGAFNPFFAKDTLWYNDYTLNGLKIANEKTTGFEKNIDTVSPTEVTTLYTQQNIDNGKPTKDSLANYEIRKYNVTAHSINFHSITLSGSDFESFDNLKPGIFWLSNDILNTTQAKLGYEYDTEIRKNKYSAQITYQRYFPKLTIAYNNQGQIGQARRKDGSMLGFDWREHFITANIQLPFTIYRRSYTYSYGFNFGTSYLQRYDISIEGLSGFATTMRFPLNYQAYLNRNKLMSNMDLAPRWGQNISVTYRHLPFENNTSGNTWSVRTNFYFPGVSLNHSLQIRYSFQEKSGRYLYNNDIPLPNAFSFYPTELLKSTLLLDYRLPLAYPDWSLGSLAYVKRIKTTFSADYQNIETSTIAPKTFGAALSIDLNLFKYPLPNFSLSGRITYINDNRATQRLVPTYSLSYTY